MRRGVLVLMVLAALACRGEKTTDEAVESAAESATAGRATSTQGTQRTATDTSTSAMPSSEQLPSAKSCLELVRAKRYAEAVPPCTEAVQKLPDDQELAKALEEARAEASKQAAAKAQEALGSAAGSMPDAGQQAEGVGEAASGLLGGKD